jgi:hypothetical protein
LLAGERRQAGTNPGRAREAENERYAGREQRRDGGATGKSAVGHDPREAAAQQVAHAPGQDCRVARVPGVPAQQGKGDDLARGRVGGQVQPIAPQHAAVLPRPALAQALPVAPAPVGHLVGIEGSPNAARALGEFGTIGGFDGRAQRLGREVGQTAMQGLGRGQAGQAQHGGEQRVSELAQVVGPAAPVPGEDQPDQAQHQGGQPALAAVEIGL